LLTGKFDLDKPGPEGARRSTFDFPPTDRPKVQNVINALREVSQAMGNSVSRVALAWLLTRPFVTSVIIGAKTMEQLVDNLGAGDVKLDAEHIAKLDAASALSSEYPGWMVQRQNQDRRPASVA
jgi:aryl-alcohol dehydrogenase-like predicted oxidoreductase